mmetsp:Transcript_106742/g.211980  ORF Transcript_106742/g.211980 Transcript_106742/m.211980 type:complete len:89 (-) Transcript_106742:80-346(-)
MIYLLKAWFALATLAMAAVPKKGIAETACQHEDCVNDDKKLLAKEHFAGKVETLDATELPPLPHALREKPATKRVRRNARNVRKNSRK